MHGTVHSFDETLDDHHNGRCAMIPIVPLAESIGIKPPEIEPGETVFGRLSDEEQRARMGPGKWEAWKAGKFQFSDLSQSYEDKVYGTMRGEPSLKALLGETAQ